MDLNKLLQFVAVAVGIFYVRVDRKLCFEKFTMHSVFVGDDVNLLVFLHPSLIEGDIFLYYFGKNIHYTNRIV